MTDARHRIATLPCWQGTPMAEPLAGGLSNEIWKVTDDAGAHVVRFGADYPFHHVSRAREAMTARAAHAAGFAPAVEYATPGVMVTEFVTARTWDAGDVRSNAPRVADLLRRFHATMGERISGTFQISLDSPPASGCATGVPCQQGSAAMRAGASVMA